MELGVPVHYARAAGVSLAYQRWGAGPARIIAIPPMAQNIELMWERPEYRYVLHRFGSFAHVVHFDKRGTGRFSSANGIRLATIGGHSPSWEHCGLFTRACCCRDHDDTKGPYRLGHAHGHQQFRAARVRRDYDSLARSRSWPITSVERVCMKAAQLAAVAGNSRVRRSFGFLDLSGFTDFVDSQGDHAAVSEVLHLRATVREVAPLFGVRVEKWLGDGCMLVGVDDDLVVAALVGASQRHQDGGGLPIRAGIASGEVLLLEGDDYIGRAVNLAARLCDRAKPGEVLAESVGLHLPTWVELCDERTLSVKGFQERVSVGTLISGLEVRDRRPPTLPAIVGGLTQPVRTVFGGLSRGATRSTNQRS